jgi:hypothetical protein
MARPARRVSFPYSRSAASASGGTAERGPSRAIRGYIAAMLVGRYHPALSFQGGSSMRKQALLVALALVLAPLGAKAADLVVWWDEGYYPEEREAVEEIVAAFEQETGKQVELASCFRHQSEDGRSTIGSWISPPPSATFQTCLIPMRSP